MNSKISEKDKKTWDEFLSNDQKLPDKDNFQSEIKSKKTRYTLYSSDGKEEINFCDPSPVLLHLATNYNPNPRSIEEEKEIREANYLFPKNIAANFSKVISICSYQQLLDAKYQNLYSETKTEFNKWCQSKVDQFIKIYLFDSFGYGDTRNKVVDVFIKNSIESPK